MRIIRFLIALLCLMPLYAHAVAEASLLDPQEAFKYSAGVLDARNIEARFQVAKDYHLYRDKVKFEVTTKGVELGPVQLPPGKVEEDAIFGRTAVYRDDVRIKLPLNRIDPNVRKITLKVVSQGCADAGVCFPPQTHESQLDLPAVPGKTAGAGISSQDGTPLLEGKAASDPGTAPIKSMQSESTHIENLFRGGSFWLIVSFFYGAGMLLALTPCVFPMIPILSGCIAGQGQQLTKTRAFVLSLSYVLGMAITYALVGIAAGLSGSLLSAALQNPWVLGSFALVFVVLAFSMFGFYELQLPNAIQS